MAKTSAKTSKMSGAPPWTPTKPWRTKMEVGGEWRRRVCDWCMGQDLNFVVKSTLPPLFTKLPLCHSELQKCHYSALNVGPFTQMTWK